MEIKVYTGLQIKQINSSIDLIDIIVSSINLRRKKVKGRTENE